MYSLDDLATAFEDVLWSLPREQLLAGEPTLRALLAGLHLPPADLLVRLCDESLARTYQARLFRRPVFEEWLVNRYESALHRWFLRRTNDPDRTDDLIQELYVKLLTGRALDGYDADRAFRPWLWRVVHNYWIDHLRRHQPDGPLPRQEGPSDDPGPLEEVIARELHARLEPILLSLPSRQQQVFQLAVQGHEADHIARELAIPRAAVYRNLFQARRAIEQALGPEDRAPG